MRELGNKLIGDENIFSFEQRIFNFVILLSICMLGLGSIISALGKRFTQKVMSAGAVLVVVLGLAMLSQGGSLSGFLPPNLLLAVILALCAVGAVSSIQFRKPSYQVISTVGALSIAILLSTSGNLWNLNWGEKAGSAVASDIQIVDGKQVVNSTLASGRYPNITVQAGTPVKWVIDAPKGSINGCNNRMLIQDYGIEYSFETGENVVEFTPTKTGTVRYSCWMGMIRGNITVIDAGATLSSGNGTGSTGAASGNVENFVPTSGSGGCCGRQQ